MRTERLILTLAFSLSGLLLAGVAAAEGAAEGAEKQSVAERRLLRASEGLQMPGSEADSGWWFVAYPGEVELPAAGRMAELTGCAGGVTRSDFDEALGDLSRVEPWMDRGQRKSARGFGRLARVFHRLYGEEVAVYRCETGGPEVPIYFVGVDGDGLSGLETVNIET